MAVDRFTEPAVYSPVIIDCDIELTPDVKEANQSRYDSRETPNVALINDLDESHSNNQSQHDGRDEDSVKVPLPNMYQWRFVGLYCQYASVGNLHRILSITWLTVYLVVRLVVRILWYFDIFLSLCF